MEIYDFFSLILFIWFEIAYWQCYSEIEHHVCELVPSIMHRTMFNKFYSFLEEKESFLENR